MGRKTNEELIAEYHRTKKDEVLVEILEKNDRLNYMIAHRFKNSGESIEDLASMCKIGMLKSIHSFKTDKGIKFTSYACRVMTNEILMFMRDNKKHQQVVMSLDQYINSQESDTITLLETIKSEEDLLGDIIDREELQNVRDIVNWLKDRDKDIIENIYFKNKTQKDTSKIIGASQSYISRLEKDILDKMRRKILAKQ